jgi:hypothetical protein
MLTWPISLAFDRCCLLLMASWRPLMMKLIFLLAFWNTPLGLLSLGGGGGEGSF